MIVYPRARERFQMASNSTPASNGPRLRTACDACQAYKVKCSRGKPSCWRCSENGTPCVYSPLRRTGRPPKRASTVRPSGRDGKTSDSASNRPSRQENEARAHESPAQPGERQPPWITPQPSPPSQLFRQEQSERDAARVTTSGPGGALFPSASGEAMEGTTVSSQIQDNQANSRPEDDRAFQGSMNDLPADDFSLDTSSLGLDMTFDNSDLLPAMLDFDPSDSNAGLLASEAAAYAPQADGSRAYEASRPNVATNRERLLSANFAFHTDILLGESSTDQLPTSPISPRASSTSSCNVASNGATGQINFLPLDDNIHTPTSCPLPTFWDLNTFAPAQTPRQARAYSIGGGIRTDPNHGREASMQVCTCYQALSTFLGKTGVYDSGDEGDDCVSLDTLLELNREIQATAQSVLHCRRCMKMSNSQNIFMLIYMALDNLLHLFEKQQLTKWHATPVATKLVLPEQTIYPPRRPTVTTMTAWRGSNMAPAGHHKVPGNGPQAGSTAGFDGSRVWAQYPDCEKPLAIGSYVVDESVKATFLSQLVLKFIGDLLTILSELNTQSADFLRGANSKIAKDKAIDIHRRAIFLRGRLRLGI